MSSESQPEPSVTEGAELLGPDGKVDLDALRAVAQEDDGDGDPAARRVVFTLSRDLRKRLDKYITDRAPFLSRNQAQRLIDEGDVTVNGRGAKPSTTLRQGDIVALTVPPVGPLRIEPEPVPLDVLYEDRHIIVINKQPGVIVHPARSHTSGTMINGLAWHFQHTSSEGGGLSGVGEEDARPGVVHRLDRDTTGVIVFAKDDEAHWRLGHMFEKRQVDKRYVALVHGVIEPQADVIDLPLGPHPNRAKGFREKQVVRHDDFGKASVTLYRTLERYDGFSLLELELRTGRTHQIRVHLSHLGWPIVGDDMYGGKILSLCDLAGDGRDARPTDDRADEVIMGRQALHAALLSFKHPMSQEQLTFTAPIRGDMARCITLLREQKPGEGPIDVSGARVDFATLTSAISS